ncbi:hypothetical protein DIE19_36085 [Burkholderia sp. Bp9126]|nr:hypothetical protein DIE19_36085 [Burkholderia sp. Bp9126]
MHEIDRNHFDDATAIADLEPTVAERVFAIAGEDQREIDKRPALQADVCAVWPETQECSKPAAPGIRAAGHALPCRWRAVRHGKGKRRGGRGEQHRRSVSKRFWIVRRQ